MKIYFAGLVSAILFLAVRAELECTCPEDVHPQADFCNKYTDFVIRARILSEKEEKDAEEDGAGLKYHKMKYRVKVASVYKGGLYLNVGDEASIFLPPNRCGFHLEKDKFYLIAGTGTKAFRLMSNVCHWISRMSDLTLHQKMSLDLNRYKQSCNWCTLDKSGCAMDPAVDENCYDRYATCYQQPETPNKCSWRYGTGFNICKINGAP